MYGMSKISRSQS